MSSTRVRVGDLIRARIVVAWRFVSLELLLLVDPLSLSPLASIPLLARTIHVSTGTPSFVTHYVTPDYDAHAAKPKVIAGSSGLLQHLLTAMSGDGFAERTLVQIFRLLQLLCLFGA